MGGLVLMVGYFPKAHNTETASGFSEATPAPGLGSWCLHAKPALSPLRNLLFFDLKKVPGKI